MRPLFKVGEEVILCSEVSPGLNGDASVIDIHGPRNGRCVVTNIVTFGFGYTLNIPSGAPGGIWAESALRKKHKPAEGDFVEVMTSLIFEPVEA